MAIEVSPNDNTVNPQMVLTPAKVTHLLILDARFDLQLALNPAHF
ncbi:MAG: hypothetical protein ABSE46_03610 [Terracidiphilus sp.]|jgi:hypothetical protein